MELIKGKYEIDSNLRLIISNGEVVGHLIGDITPYGDINNIENLLEMVICEEGYERHKIYLKKNGLVTRRPVTNAMFTTGNKTIIVNDKLRILSVDGVIVGHFISKELKYDYDLMSEGGVLVESITVSNVNYYKYYLKENGLIINR